MLKSKERSWKYLWRYLFLNRFFSKNFSSFWIRSILILLILLFLINNYFPRSQYIFFCRNLHYFFFCRELFSFAQAFYFRNNFFISSREHFSFATSFSFLSPRAFFFCRDTFGQNCVKSLCIRSYSGQEFPAFRLNNSEYRHFSRNATMQDLLEWINEILIRLKGIRPTLNVNNLPKYETEK